MGVEVPTKRIVTKVKKSIVYTVDQLLDTETKLKACLYFTYLSLFACRNRCQTCIGSFHRIGLLLLQIQEVVELNELIWVTVVTVRSYGILDCIRVTQHFLELPNVDVKFRTPLLTDILHSLNLFLR